MTDALPKAKHATHWLVLGALGLGAAACSHPVQRKLEGRWLGQAVENFDDDQVAAATGWARGTSMEFAGSSITVAIPAEEPRIGEYEVAQVHKNRVVLAVKGSATEPQNVRFVLDSDRSMRWMLSDGRAVVLRRE